jgi:hypothetical protein
VKRAPLLRRFVALAVAAAPLGAPAGAAAEQLPAAPAEHIALVYQAPPECPADDAFRSEVRSRVTGDWEARPGELARRVSVSVAQRADRYVATIEFLDPQGERVARSVAGVVCADVVNGIALVTALAIQSRVEEALAQSEPEPTPTPPPPAPLPPAPAATPARPAASPAPQPERGPPPRRAHVRFGGSATVATGVGPEPALGAALFAAFEWSGPRVGLTAEASWSGRVQASDVPAHFQRYAARLEGCPVSFGLGVVSFEPCASFELGLLRGDGDSLTKPGLATLASGGGSPWLAPGALGRLVASFDPIVVLLEATAGVPLVREKFGLLLNQTEQDPKFQAPSVVFGGSLGLGVRL